MNAVSLLSIIKAASYDCLNLLVLILLLGGMIFTLLPVSRRVYLFLTFYLSGIFTLGSFYLLPYAAIPTNSIFFCLLWSLGLSLIAYIEWEERKPHPQKRFRSLTLILHGFALFVFCFLCGVAIYQWNQDSITWKHINLISFTTLFFILIYHMEPWRLIPKSAQPFFGQIILYGGIGLYLLNLSMWGYAGFHAVFNEGSGSFRMKGKTFALDYARNWKFTKLENLILKHWYYPTPINEKTKIPVAAEKMDFFLNGIKEANAFRLSLLPTDEYGICPALRIIEALKQFQQKAKHPLKGRPGLQTFELNQEQLLRQFEGKSTRLKNKKIFTDFEGKWFGEWDGMMVAHNWNAVDLFNPPYIIEGDNVLELRALQYAWIGDGFGWNAKVHPLEQEEGETILGSVYHVIDKDENRIRTHRPHVGLYVEKNHLIWVTEGEIFFEKIYQNNNQEERYSITGFFYEIKEGSLINRGQAFQAIYTRDPEIRPDFYRFDVSISTNL